MEVWAEDPLELLAQCFRVLAVGSGSEQVVDATTHLTAFFSSGEAFPVLFALIRQTLGAGDVPDHALVSVPRAVTEDWPHLADQVKWDYFVALWELFTNLRVVAALAHPFSVIASIVHGELPSAFEDGALLAEMHRLFAYCFDNDLLPQATLVAANLCEADPASLAPDHLAAFAVWAFRQPFVASYVRRPDGDLGRRRPWADCTGLYHGPR
jgi:hypothetical protein